MKNLQIFTSIDPLFNFKTKLILDNPNYELRHIDTNRPVQIGYGYHDEDSFTEEVITDGDIYVKRLVDDMPTIVWNEELVKLSNGAAMLLEINNSTYTIFSVTKNNETRYNICVKDDDRESYEKAISVLKDGNKKNYAAIDKDGVLSIEGAKVFEKIKIGNK